MIDPLLETWKHTATATSTSIVVPDGCRDLIRRSSHGQAPVWFVTSLDNCARTVSTKAGDSLMGFRLKPGTSIDSFQLRKATDTLTDESDVIATRIIATRVRETCTILSNVDAALASLASSCTVKEAARQSGVRPRTLQRLLLRETGRRPQFWLQLARVRRAAQGIATTKSLVELALDSGFSDQAHMTRHFRRWFDVTPTQFAANADLLSSVQESGYD